MASTPRTAAPKTRYCGPCDEYTNANPCTACGADTDRVPTAEAWTGVPRAVVAAQSLINHLESMATETIVPKPKQCCYCGEPCDGQRVTETGEPVCSEACGRDWRASVEEGQ